MPGNPKKSSGGSHVSLVFKANIENVMFPPRCLKRIQTSRACLVRAGTCVYKSLAHVCCCFVNIYEGGVCPKGACVRYYVRLEDNTTLSDMCGCARIL